MAIVRPDRSRRSIPTVAIAAFPAPALEERAEGTRRVGDATQQRPADDDEGREGDHQDAEDHKLGFFFTL